ncbi:FACT complex subunit SPT16 [Heterostelium album PN500]|uniref:FACT complex subunit n=1 Tax=Heterostelium pallidum (strain ATCC 26659 / Pp 5 / PN500) TaxID=670386 RepID=D3AWW1_HETP5|nr:FACT complex subunit SPT16 [Heterostelium album PN500]EFA86784.1 FACT complex subunit SPT16 [Heterostelium album PN500]|eukprot:XP_020438888.1 FACT complex subunit SPT16 [Heterostelium album PN500]
MDAKTSNGGSTTTTTTTSNGSSDVRIDSKTFNQRLRSLYQSWENAENDALWKSADCLVLALGAPNDQNPYQKVTMMQSWLFGYELRETLIVFLKKSIHIVASQKKISIFEAIDKPEEGEQKPFHFHTIDKSDNNKANFESVIAEMKKSKTGKHMGVIGKEKYLGDFGKSWEEAIESSGMEKVDITQGLSSLLAIKDTQELVLMCRINYLLPSAVQKNITYSAKISDKVLMSFLLPRIEKIIDKEEKESHSQLTEFTLDVFNAPEKISTRLTKDTVDYAYMPIIQSGGVYDLKFNATSNEDNLHFGTIVVSLGARYKTYCSNIARTYIIDPVDEQQKNYQLLLNVQNQIIKQLKPGVKFSQIYEKATQVIEAEKPELLKYFLKSCGYGIGLEFQESYANISASNQKLIKGGMVLNVVVGFQNIEAKKFKDDKSKLYSLMIGDTVSIDDEGKVNVLTSECGKKPNDVFYFISEDGDTMDDSTSAKHDPSLVLEMTDDLKAITGKKRDSKRTAEEKRKDHQNMLAQRNLEETEAKIRAMEKKTTEGGSKQGTEDYSMFNNPLTLYNNGPAGYPSDVVKNKITIDMNKESILLPIYGYIVPFHISTIKNVSKTEEYLRINFNTPSSFTPEQAELVPKQLLFIREVTFRVQDIRTLNNYVRIIKEMRKRVTTRETETRDKSTLIAQEKLILTRGRFPRLADVSVRPTISGRRSLGNLEAHDNGLRFNPTGNKDKTPIDILYKNIKHALFQQAEQESMVIIHFHLYDALMIGKKKSKDVQFYSEISELSQSLDVTSRSMSDELEEERREREIKKKLNTEYQNFVKRVEELVPGGGFEFDIPYRDLAFYGVPNVNTVLLQPSVQCLVSLLETPFFVLTLEEVEIACFERVSRALRNFDLVFVFKDYSRPTIRISIIPREYFETIKEWLDSCNIKFYMSERNLNWKRIMVEIKSDLKRWKEDGGWSFLDPQGDGGGGSGGEDSDDDEDYEPTESDVSSDYLSSQSSMSSDYSEEESEDSGEDWDTLDSKAAAADRRSNIDESQINNLNQNQKRKRDPPPPAKKPTTKGAPIPKKK